MRNLRWGAAQLSFNLNTILRIRIALCACLVSVGCATDAPPRVPLLAFSAEDDVLPEGMDSVEFVAKLTSGVKTVADPTTSEFLTRDLDDTFHIRGPYPFDVGFRQYTLGNMAGSEVYRRLPDSLEENLACLDLTPGLQGSGFNNIGDNGDVFDQENYFAFTPATALYQPDKSYASIRYVIAVVTAPQTRFRVKLRNANLLTREQRTRYAFQNVSLGELLGLTNVGGDAAELDELIMDIQNNDAYLWEEGKHAEVFATDASARAPRSIRFIDQNPSGLFDYGNDGHVLYIINIVLEADKCMVGLNGSGLVELPRDRCRVRTTGMNDDVSAPDVLIAASSRNRRDVVNGFCVSSAFASATEETIE